MADPRDMFRTDSSSLVPRADRRRQLIAFATISGLVLVAFGLWFVAILTSSDRDQLEIAEGPPPTEQRPVAEEEDEQDEDGQERDVAPDDGTTGDEDAVAEPDRVQPEIATEERFASEPDTGPESATDRDADGGSDDDTSGAADTDEADDSGSDDDTSSEDDAGADNDTEPEPDADDDADAGNADDTDVVSVTLDEVCTVELDAEEREAARQAWEYADCTWAPVPVDDGGESWIVVRASMPSDEVDAAAAQQRAGDLGVDGGVLWSSHYPSLNPDYWVAYDGPFPDAESARNAAGAVDGEAYARALTADDGDR